METKRLVVPLALMRSHPRLRFGLAGARPAEDPEGDRVVRGFQMSRST